MPDWGNTRLNDKNDKKARGISASVAGLAQGPLSAESSFRMAMVAGLAAVVGVAAGVLAYLLYNLIGFFTNIAFFHQATFVFRSARLHHLGPWVIIIPVVGGLLVGLMAKYGSSKIRGHGI